MTTPSLVGAAEATAYNLQKGTAPVSTGIGFLDHMLDQLYSHAQIGLDYELLLEGDDGDSKDGHNRNATRYDQKELLASVGGSVGKALRALLVDPQTCAAQQQQEGACCCSTFACPLDEALTVCQLERCADDAQLQSYNLAPYGKFPKTGRTHIGRLETAALRSFWEQLAKSAGLRISFDKIRGDNGHHIVESSFKAFSRALRNLLDGVDTIISSQCTRAQQQTLDNLYGPASDNCQASMALKREASVTRNTKETSISTTLKLDGGASGVSVQTGVQTLDHFFTEFARAADLSLEITCQGDLWIDEHHTAEDVAIAVGQVLTTALGTKAGLNRMWCATSVVNENTQIQVTMDLSNRPCLTHNLSLQQEEMVGDLSLEMLDHVLDSVVVNGRMTVHIVEVASNNNLLDTVTATARALGQALKYCAMMDGRRAGATASSKGTLSV